MNFEKFEQVLREECTRACSEFTDPSHDFAHFSRVAHLAKKLALTEGADLEIVIAAAWLHDLVHIPKNDSRRTQASRISADAAEKVLQKISFISPEKTQAVRHAIEAHSFSANIKAETIEAKVVQDADRLEALGAIGIARCFSTGAQMGAEFYHALDPLAKDRDLNDRGFSVDHFFVKLFKLEESFHTESAKKEARNRIEFMHEFLKQLGSEAGWG